MTRLLAPSSAEVGCAPPVGCTISSVSERTVVQDVGPNVSGRPGRFRALMRLEPAACCQAAAVKRQFGAQPLSSELKVVVPCCVAEDDAPYDAVPGGIEVVPRERLCA